MNDVFVPKAWGIRSFDISIYDRWGELIFQSSEITQGWDGTHKGKPCKDDVYAWQAFYTTIRGDVKKITGHVSLLR